ncbi:F-box/LRR-repeat protein At3g48880-like [Chenopodium quinoa]|uniref:F-box domain-containing protein n=1 Tax=Chenopodium quinoa TaxID=63459 RepID=A0A803LK07_CHEQI|nr:F-box/LRR-repeat protein At3g48880-like [Chenopodium quinoa]
MVSEKSLKRAEPDWRLKKCAKRNVVAKVDEESDSHLIRRWEEMNHEILVSIMKRLGVLDLIFSICFVCKSWLDATLDTFFPPQDVFSLSDFPLLLGSSSYNRRVQRRRFWRMVELHLNRDQARLHTKLVLPCIRLNKYGYLYIAKRLPSLRSLSLHMDSLRLRRPFLSVASYWKGLVEVECFGSCVKIVSELWNQIHTLRLLGEVQVTDAVVIARNFPRLTHLSLKKCTLMDNALSLILEGQKNLIYLDTTHALLREKNVCWAKDWDEDLLLKASRVTQYLRCEMRNCRYCYKSYSL